MIRFQKGNILKANAEALINTVNTVGIMGKGIALQFKEAFPENFKLYKQAADKKELHTGKMFITTINRFDGVKYLINFPTKQEWFKPSSYKYIEEGLEDLVNIIQQYQIKSIAIPPLGCGNGGLDWEKVKAMILLSLEAIPNLDVLIYEPDMEVNQILQQQEKGKEVKLTPARAMLLYALFHYEVMGEEASLFVANKLSYFLQRFGEKQLKLNFVHHYYCPYPNQVDHLMYELNGKYIKGLEQRSAKPFDPIHLNYLHLEEVKNYVNTNLDTEEKKHLDTLLEFIDGYQSPLALEALSSVDMLLNEKNNRSADEIYLAIQGWTDRKKNLFTPKHIAIALEHIKGYEKSLFPEDVKCEK